MIQLATREACTGCTACKATCPKNAIVMIADEEGFWRPQINREECVECHACERACPVLHPYNPDDNPQCYAARVKDVDLRLASSSGGLFTVLARPVLQSGGVVFGCVWEKPQLVAIHAKAETEEELAAMRGSKYVQSDLRDTYREVKAALKQNRKVLFSGTPCQIAGLNQYLGRPNENLLTVEIICHGAPSPAVFEAYKREIEKAHGASPVSISFRNKFYSWRRFSLVSTFADTSENREDLYTNPYVQAFLKDLCLRPSCYACSAKANRSRADITIADFWGIEKVSPSLDDDRGTSAILLHTEKAQKIWEAIERVEFEPVTLQSILKGNPAYIRSVCQPRKRNYFMQQFRMAPSMGALVKKCTYVFLPIRIARSCLKRLKRIIKKILGVMK